MRQNMKRLLVMFMAVIMMVTSSLPAFAAASRYGEDKPLKTVSKRYYIESDNGTSHKHWVIKTSNGVEYLLYDSCMKGMVGSTPTNHSSTLTIDGVKYSLRNYRRPNSYYCSYANVIKKIGGSSSASGASGTKKVALQKITLNRSSVTVTAGKTTQLTISYTPSNTTDSKKAVWSSSNSSVASVSGGKVTAKKAGTATITAKVGSRKASCKVTVKAKSTTGGGTSSSGGSASAGSGNYKNVSDAYKVLNTFRTTKSNQWYWNSSNTKKVTTYGLKALKRDAALEAVAKTRAKEQWTQYYVNGKLTHTRPNGRDWTSAYPAGMGHIGENLAWGHMTSSEAITEPNYGWAETYKKYSGQGHRRSMLDSRFTKVGIACYVKDGKTCWAMCLGN